MVSLLQDLYHYRLGFMKKAPRGFKWAPPDAFWFFLTNFHLSSL